MVSHVVATFINFDELPWNYEFIIMKFTFTKNHTFLRKFGAIRYYTLNNYVSIFACNWWIFLPPVTYNMYVGS